MHKCGHSLGASFWGVIIRWELDHVSLALDVSYFVFSSQSRSKSGVDYARSKSEGWASHLVLTRCRLRFTDNDYA